MLERPNWALERLYQEVAPPIGESEAITHSADKPKQPAAIGGYLEEPLYNRKQLAQEHFDETHVLPRTVDSNRPGSSDGRRAKLGLVTEPDILKARAERQSVAAANPAARSIWEKPARGKTAVERSTEGQAAYQAGVGSSFMPSPSP